MSAEATPSFDNEDMAAAVAGQYKDTKQSKREEHAQAQSDKRAILDSFEGKCHIRLGGTRLEMYLLDAKTEDWLEEVGVRFSGFDEESQLTPEQQEEYIEARDRMVEILAEHTVNEDYDIDFWRQVPKRYRQETIASLIQGGEEASRAGN